MGITVGTWNGVEKIKGLGFSPIIVYRAWSGWTSWMENGIYGIGLEFGRISTSSSHRQLPYRPTLLLSHLYFHAESRPTSLAFAQAWDIFTRMPPSCVKSFRVSFTNERFLNTVYLTAKIVEFSKIRPLDRFRKITQSIRCPFNLYYLNSS